MNADDPAFLLCVRMRRDSGTEGRLRIIEDAVSAHAAKMRQIPLDADMALWCAPATRVSARSGGGRQVLVIGECFSRSSPLSADGTVLNAVADDPASILERCWGRYLYVDHDAGGRLSIVRDPIGSMPAWTIDHDGVLVMADALPAWLLRASGAAIAPDLRHVATALAHPPFATWHSLLAGIALVPAGVVLHHGNGRVRNGARWQPIRLSIDDGGHDPDRSAAALRESVDRSIAAWSACFPNILVELSGGLDSSILLATLARTPVHRGLHAVNFTTGWTEGDERSAARAVARQYDVALDEIAADAQPMHYADFAADAAMAAPQLYGLDPRHEALAIALADDLRVDAIATGQGGDALFFQMPSPLVVCDRVRDQGWGGGLMRLVIDSAHRAHCSAWRVLALALRDRMWGTPASLDRYDSRLLADAAMPRPVHPWLEAADTLPPAKRLQLEAIANCQLFFTPTRRSRHRPLLHPLLSQPVVETCLAIPSYTLAGGRQDRQLARQAFSRRLPAEIIRRHVKGEAASYFSRAVTADLPFLREYLLDGELVRHHLLDAAALEVVLDEDHLVWADQARPLILYASFESWLRRWRGWRAGV